MSRSTDIRLAPPCIKMRRIVCSFATVCATYFAGSGTLLAQASREPDSAQAVAIVHRFTPTWTLIEHVDTVWSIHVVRATSRDGLNTRDVFVFRGDSVVLLRPSGPVALPAAFARRLHQAIWFAKQQEQLEQKLGRSLR